MDIENRIKNYFDAQKEVLCAYLFGSTVTGKDNKFSDVDVAVLFDPNLAQDRYTEERLAIMDNLSRILNKDIDVVVLNEASSFLKFQIIKEGSFAKLSLDLEEISRIWNNSSVIRSFLLGLAHEVFEQDQELHDIVGEIAQGGTGEWTVQEAKKHNIPAPVIDHALQVRQWSRESGGNYATKLIAMLRNKFGGHPVKKTKESR